MFELLRRDWVLEDVQWSDYVIHSINREPGPSYTLNYDPEVVGA